MTKAVFAALVACLLAGCLELSESANEPKATGGSGGSQVTSDSGFPTGGNEAGDDAAEASDGAAEAGGGTAGAAGAAGAAGSAGSNPCGSKPDNTPCGVSTCSGTTTQTAPVCLSGTCKVVVTECGLFLCSAGACLTACSSTSECVSPYQCVGTSCTECATCRQSLIELSPKPVCPGNSTTLADSMKTCCAAQCSATCTGTGLCGGSLPPSNPCLTCIAYVCPGEYNACNSG